MSITDLAKPSSVGNEALAHNPSTTVSLHELAALKISSGEIECAMVAYSRCITFAPQNALPRAQDSDFSLSHSSWIPLVRFALAYREMICS